MVAESDPSQLVQQVLLPQLESALVSLRPQSPLSLPRHMCIEITHVGSAGVVHQAPPDPAMLVASQERVWNHHQTWHTQKETVSKENITLDRESKENITLDRESKENITLD